MAIVANSTPQISRQSPTASPPPSMISRQSSFVSTTDDAELLDTSSISSSLQTTSQLPRQSRTKHHPLHSNTASITSLASEDLDDPTITIPVSELGLSDTENATEVNESVPPSSQNPLLDTPEKSPYNERENSNSNIRDTIQSRTLLKSHSHRSTPRLGLKSQSAGIPLPPTLTSTNSSGSQSSSSSVNRLSARSNSTGNHSVSSLSGMAALVSLRNMLEQNHEAGASSNVPEHHPANINDNGRRSLFDEVSFNSAPGNLHLLSDSAIERFVGRYGTANVVRQLAADLAQRESEVILVRKQQEDRERELKKLLAQCGVSMADIDKRLLNMTATSVRRPKEVLDELIYQAINEEHDISKFNTTNNSNTNTNDDNDQKDLDETHDTDSKKLSRSNSVASESKPLGLIPSHPPSKRRSWATFFFGGSNPDERKSKNLNAYPESIISEDDTESLYSTETNAYSYPAPQEDLIDKGSILSGNSNKHNTMHPSSLTSPTSHRPRSSSQAFNPVEWIPKTLKDHVPQNVQNVVSPPPVVNDKRPLELDNIVPQSIQPPTLLPSWNNHYGLPDRYLTDRFGFIYDRHKDLSSTNVHETEPEDAPIPENSSVKENVSKVNRQTSVKIIDGDEKTGIRVIPPNMFQPEVVAQNATALLTTQPTNSNSEGESEVNSGNAQRSPDARDVRDTSRGPNSVRMLLAQLTDMHDTLQKAQTTRWDEFLEKLNSIADAEPSEFIQNGTELLGVSGTGLAGGDTASGFSFSLVSGNGSTGGNSLGGVGFSKKKKSRSPKEGKQLWREFKTLVLGGVPVAYRAKIWGECSGTRSLKTPGVYQSLIDQDDHTEAMNQIDLDLYRTMPYNVFFGSSGPGVHKLRRVLVAFSRRNPEVGYCQGMNLIAAMLLLVFATEEDAFWLLVSLVENILPTGYFSPPLLTSRADQRVFNQLFKDLLPQLSAHLTLIHVEVEAITFNWFLSCFTDTLPPDVLFRVWDVFLCVEGEVYLFRLALALFKIYEPELMKLNTASEVYSFMKQLNNQPVRVESLIKQADQFNQQVVDHSVKQMRLQEIDKLLEELRVV